MVVVIDEKHDRCSGVAGWSGADVRSPESAVRSGVLKDCDIGATREHGRLVHFQNRHLERFCVAELLFINRLWAAVGDADSNRITSGTLQLGWSPNDPSRINRHSGRRVHDAVSESV